MQHLEQHISLDSRMLGWVDAAKDQDLLSFAGSETLGFNFKGTTDVLVAIREAIKDLLPNRGMLLLIELKKQLTSTAVLQAQARLLLANLHSPETRPVMVSLDFGLSLMHSGRSHNITSACAQTSVHFIAFLSNL